MCWITLEASINEPDSSAIFCVTAFDVTSVALPSPVAAVSVLITSSVFPSVCPMEAIFATISSTDDDDCATLAACVSILLLSCLMVRTISSMVAAVSVTLAAWFIVCCFTPSMFALISLTALAVSLMLEASSLPISSISLLFDPTCWIEVPIFLIVSLKYSAISVISSLPCTGSRTVKSPSPWAIFFKAATAFWIGLTIVRATK